MSRGLDERAEELFLRAVEFDQDAERDAWLRHECGDDLELENLVRELCGADSQVTSVLDDSGRVARAALVALADAGGETASRLAPGIVLGGYRLIDRLGKGGMGEVWEAEQVSVKRRIALKVLVQGLGEHALERFGREARAGARVEHPGVVRVFDAGVDSGLPWIAQELVAGGRTLREQIVEWHRGDRSPHDLPRRAADMVRKVAEALGAAHGAGVIHRDVKPRNILIDPAGEPKVGDFGLARLQEEPSISRTGDLAGTYLYMSPEQVSGERGAVEARTDVFSLGVVLYEALTGVRPFDGDNLQAISLRILNHDPASPRSLRPGISRDLETICMKALEKRPAERYGSMSELEADLRSVINGEPIRARPPGPIARARRFARRNPARATGLVVGVVGALAVGYLYLGGLQRERELLRLSDLQRVEELQTQATLLWPPHPENIEPYQEWIEVAEDLAQRLEGHRLRLERLRTSASTRPPLGEEDPEAAAALRRLASLKAMSGRVSSDAPVLTPRLDAGQREAMAAEIAELEVLVGQRVVHRLPNPEEQWQHNTLARLVEGLEGLFAPERGLIHDIRQRLSFAQRVEQDTVSGPQASQAWDQASAAIEASPLYGGLHLEPQMGLLPLGPDPDSGLWEFVHLQSGVAPRRDPDSGLLDVDGTTGIVLVLLPGGIALRGAQNEDPAAPRFDADARPIEGPPAEVRLDAFFLAKHETTQGQWMRLTKENPSGNLSGETDGGQLYTDAHPVDSIAWGDADLVFSRAGLSMPTEARWEYGARAGSQTPWWTGGEGTSVEGAANLADRTARNWGKETVTWNTEDWLDGFVSSAPVGSFRANGFGLHDTIGNVWEIVSDWYGPLETAREGDGELEWLSRVKLMRGGSYGVPTLHARVTERARITPADRMNSTGARAAREIEPAFR